MMINEEVAEWMNLVQKLENSPSLEIKALGKWTMVIG
jgi:hypothetical protein